MAAILEGFEWMGCEMTEGYVPLIEGRVRWAQDQLAETVERGAEGAAK
ncbi:MAG: hypothetical protein KGR42_06405 [Acidobacteria bacterium]|nr:hypothetical protein [Acidobacteriota bacterium]